MVEEDEIEIRGVKRPLVENYSDDEEEEEARRKEEHSAYQSRHCPYLDTIDRHVLDFDFEKLCSVSLSHINVYACLVCGKYFQGRGRRSHAYTHSVQVDHHVFLNLRTLKVCSKLCIINGIVPVMEKPCFKDIASSVAVMNNKPILQLIECSIVRQVKSPRENALYNQTLNGFLNHKDLLHMFYCLPDNYEVIDSSLDDIKYVLNPTFTKDDISQLDKSAKLSRAFDGTTYLPGIVGLNNIKANDYLNVILQALAFIPPVRDFFLREENYQNIKRPPGDIMFPLVNRFGELIRKIWNPRNFKAHVSPHEMLQAVVLCSKKRFQFTEQGDPVEFLSWFLNSLHTTLGGTKKATSSVIYKTFQGKMRVTARKLPQAENEEDVKKEVDEEEYKEKTSDSPYMYLMLDIPPSPLYKDEYQQNIIPQVPLFQLLSKFDGKTEKEYKTYKETFVKKFELTKLPRFLIMCVKRFTKNMFFVEKNPTVVNFPVKGVDMAEYLVADPAIQDAHPHTQYDLIANICHEGEPGKGAGNFKVHILHKGANKWYELQDLHVKEILPQVITLSDSYIQVYELQKE